MIADGRLIGPGLSNGRDAVRYRLLGIAPVNRLPFPSRVATLLMQLALLLLEGEHVRLSAHDAPLIERPLGRAPVVRWAAPRVYMLVLLVRFRLTGLTLPPQGRSSAHRAQSGQDRGHPGGRAQGSACLGHLFGGGFRT